MINYYIAHKTNKRKSFFCSSYSEGALLDHIMSLKDGDLGNYLIFQQIIGIGKIQTTPNIDFTIPNHTAYFLEIQRGDKTVTLWGENIHDCRKQRMEKYPDWIEIKEFGDPFCDCINLFNFNKNEIGQLVCGICNKPLKQ